MSNVQPSKSNTLQSIIDEIQLEVKVNADGEGFLSRRGLARLLGVSKSIFDQGGARIGGKLATTLTQLGFEVATCFNDERGIPDVVCGVVADYYGSDSHPHMTQKAKAVKLALLATSMRQLCQSAVGWQPKNNTGSRWSAEFKQMVDNAWNSVQYQANIEGQPGEQIIWHETSTQPLNQLEGYLTPAQWLSEQDVELTMKGKIRFGQMCSEQHKKAYHYSPKSGNIKGKPGNHKFYPASFEPQFKAILGLIILEPGNVE